MLKCVKCGAQLSLNATACWACKTPALTTTPKGVAASVPSQSSASVSSAYTAAAPAPAPVRPAAPPPPTAIHGNVQSGNSIDARPVLQRSVSGAFSKAEHIRDQIYSWAETELGARGIRALVLRSRSYEHPAWVKIECWMPVAAGRATERSSAIIEVHTKPYHTFELLFDATISRGNWTKRASKLSRMTESDVREIVAFVASRGVKPHVLKACVRKHGWDIWRPANRVENWRRDWPSWIAGVLSMLGGAALMTVMLIPFGILLLSLSALLWIILRRRKVVVQSSGKPLFEPRNLLRVDSWQAVVSGAGHDAAQIHQQFMNAVSQPPSHGFHARLEKIWYWGLDTKEEREQIVLSLQRGIVFFQIHPYGRDLYVGWDAHLNRGTWVEETTAAGVERSTGALTEFKSVLPGTQGVTEYDLSDVSCLLEWAHLQLQRIVKDYIAQRQIDQEIDFKILRGDRQQMTPGAPAGNTSAHGGFVRRLRQAVGGNA